ncbi:cell adhesion molecule Dscam2-like isoform X3 [Neocloeon triangulifer]|uniref:cell adhesion molecule Dscam2-like isoform X3 n=1 Tax=Neocloeon triangulifer TaxID=2078957 RepID=UPI00286F843E|nr:cell adhesion molecule Dscam2-like isoform X3 [Neocloeon triangulifer]
MAAGLLFLLLFAFAPPVWPFGNQGPSFVREPASRVDFSNSTGVRIDCSAQGSPAPVINWLSGEGKPIVSIPGTREIFSNGSLYFLPFQPSTFRPDVHTNTYKCTAANNVGKIVSREVKVRAVVIQHYEVQAISVGGMRGIPRGGTAFLRCQVPNAVKDYVSVTSWFQDGTFNIYPSKEGDGKYYMLPSGELLILKINDTDRYRTYQCRAVNHLSGATQLSVGRGAKITISDSRMPSAPRAVDKMAVVTAKKDQAAVLPCITEGNPQPTVSWFRQLDRSGHLQSQLRPIGVDERVKVVADGQCLSLLHVQPEDGGKYVCVANNSAGSTKIEITLAVTWPLSVSVQPPHATVDMGNRAQLSCTNLNDAPSTALITWSKDGQPLQMNGRVAIQDQGKVLLVENVQREDSGMYQCLIRTDDDSAQGTAEIRLGAAHPQLVYKFIRQTLQPGPPVSLKCIATGNPTPQLRWTLDGFPLPQSERFVMGQYVTIHGDVISHVNISTVQVEDGGNYQCTARNKVGEVSHSADLRIYGRPSIRRMPDVSAVAGEPLFITCPVAGYPIDTITWEKGERKLPLNRRQHVFTNGTLLIDNVQRAGDHGLYTCTATNKQGLAASQAVSLSVIVPPRIAPFDFQTDLHVGDRAGVQCFVTKGDLPLEIRWQHDGEDLGGNPKPGVVVSQLSSFTSSLSFDILGPEHAGNYTCVARNNAAETRHSSQLLVNVPPRWLREPKDRNVTRDNPVQFDCQAEGFPTPTVVWRKLIGQQPIEYQDLTVRSRGIQLFANGTLLIRQAFRDQQGQYMCEATNGVGAGLSSVVLLTVHVPPEFEVKSSQTSVRRGAGVTLRCEPKGDGPMSIVWQREGGRVISPADPRYHIKESIAKVGFLSELTIANTLKSDSDTLTCVASNPFGRDLRMFHLLVQDAPGRPLDVRVIESDSRSVRVGWLAPNDDRTPILQYVVQYHQDTGTGNTGWDGPVLQSASVSGTSMAALIAGLMPATTYRVRVLAENEQGPGEPSEPLLVRTDSEPPAAAPQNVVADSTSSTEVRVTWLPPPKALWHGDLLGFYVGYRESGIFISSLGRATGYNFTTVPFRGVENANPQTLLTLMDLKKYHKYGVVVQAFNEKGPGPLSTEVVVQTFEDVPSAAPLEIRCDPRSSQGLSISWQPPPHYGQNGIIQGYKVQYENMKENVQGQVEAETKVTVELNTELHGLQKFANYSVRVWAYTRIGDGEKSNPIFCRTDEDVPESPDEIKVVPSSLSSLIVSWLPPSRPNGQIASYKVYMRTLEGGKERTTVVKPVPSTMSHLEFSGLKRKEAYEFWVTGQTKVGEGQGTRKVHSVITSRTPAAIVSFGNSVLTVKKHKVQLPCVIVGIPEPERTWMGPNTAPVMTSERVSVQSDGTLLIVEAQKSDEGTYTCVARNEEGTDQINFQVKVQVPPSAPLLHAKADSATSLHLSWNHPDDGGSAIRSYQLNFRREGGGDQNEWEDRAIDRSREREFILRGLMCGAEYALYLIATNRVGDSSPSSTVRVRTEGGTPRAPSRTDLFASSNMSAVNVHLAKWDANSCEIRSFAIEYREKTQDDWINVGNVPHLRDFYTITGLWPGTQYIIKVVATNSAGSTTSEYTVSTQAALGGTLNPSLVNEEAQTHAPFYTDVSAIIMMLVCVVFVVLLFGSICICIKKRNAGEPIYAEAQQRNRCSSEDANDPQSLVAFHNKQNLAQREQYYAAVQKGAQTPVRASNNLDRIPEDIYPYATFHVANAQPQNSPANFQTFMYQDQRYPSGREAIPLKSNPGIIDNYTQLRQQHRKSKSFRSESEDYDSIGSDSDSEQPRSRTNAAQRRRDNGQNRRHKSNPDTSPVSERRSSGQSRRQPNVRLSETRRPSSGGGGRGGRETSFSAFPEPPSGFNDLHVPPPEMSEAECDMDTLRRIKLRQQHDNKMSIPPSEAHRNFTITV